jgi:hypothetical protein
MGLPAWANPDTKKLTRLHGTGEDMDRPAQNIYGPGVTGIPRKADGSLGDLPSVAQEEAKAEDDGTLLCQEIRDLRQRVSTHRDQDADRKLRVICTAEYARDGGPRKKVTDLLKRHGYTPTKAEVTV